MPEPLRYKRVLLKLSGEALLGDQAYGVDTKIVDRLSAEIAQAAKLGLEIGLVIGGGNIFRGIEVAKAGGNRVTGDQLGMLATVMNALTVRDALQALGVPVRVFSAVPLPTFCETFSQRDASAAMERGEVAIFCAGIGHPFFTTDTGAALRAAEMGCDAIMKGTQVDGVYSADPKKDPDAKRFDSLSHEDVIRLGLQVMDTAAVAIARDNGIPLVVFSIQEPDGFIRLVTGQGRGTVVS